MGRFFMFDYFFEGGEPFGKICQGHKQNFFDKFCRINGHMRKGGGSLAPSQARNSSSLFLLCFFSLCGKILSKVLLWG